MNSELRDLKISPSFFPFIYETRAESGPEPNEFGNFIEEVVDLARQINLEVDNDDAQKMMDSYNKELTMDELIEMQKQDTEEIDPVQS
ncbi:hypothetical protein TNCV_2993731 [Trichonephila clavipes]|nr:hypothetical protein TNCV_2993731 [Trichonephila clavipes]